MSLREWKVQESGGCQGKRDCQAPSAAHDTTPSTATHRREMLISSSTVTGRLTWPLMAKSLVPWLFLRPMEENHSGPRRRMVGLTATVSTLVTAGEREGMKEPG